MMHKALLNTTLLAALLAAGPTTLAKGDPNVVTVALSGNVETMDPHVASSRAVPFLENVYEPLVGLLGTTNALSPILAKSWTVNPDETEYTFKLRPNVKFHDGTILDANAVKYSLERVQDIKKGPYWALDYLQDVKVVDPLTVQMKIKPGGPPFLQALSMVDIVSPAAFKKNTNNNDAAQDWAATNEAGTGPYKLDQLVRGDRFVLSAFKDYWRGWKGQHFNKAVMLLVPEASTARLMLEKGDVDVSEQVPAEAIEALRKNPDIQIVETNSGVRALYLMLNTAAGPTSDLKVRQALNYLFDRDAFLKAMNGTFVASNGPVPAEFLSGYHPSIPYAKVDLNKARQLIQSSSFKNSPIDIYFTPGDKPQELAAQIIQANAAQIGVKVNVVPQDFPALLRGITAWGTSNRAASDPNYHMSNMLYTPPRMPDAYSYLWYMYHSDAQGGNGRNFSFYKNPTVDNLINKGALTSDRQARTKYYRDAVNAIIKDAPQVYIGTARKVYAMRSDIGGFYIHPTWYPAIRLYPMYRK